MNRLLAFRSLSAALLFAALCGPFAAVPGHAQLDLHRAVPPQGRALVFVYRVDPNPVPARVPVVVNKERVGELANGTFVAATIDPGNTELRIGERLVRTLTFPAAADQSYFVRVEALDTRTPVRIEAQPVSEPDGRRALEQSRLVGVAPAVVIPPLGAPPVAAPPAPTTPVAAPPVAPAPVAAPAIVPPPVAVPPAPPAEPVAVKPAAHPEVVAPTELRRESAFALIASVGTFKLADERQTVAGFPRTYDTSSKSVFGIEAEWRFSSGFAVGGEFFTYKNDLVSAAPIPNAEQKVYALMLNGKYYFHAADWFYPFVGVGVGQANASYSGGLTGNASGIAYQGLAGAEFRLKQIGLYVQYKYLASEVGDSGKEVKVNGSGVLAGISISF